jgi:hypothetical protein
MAKPKYNPEKLNQIMNPQPMAFYQDNAVDKKEEIQEDATTSESDVTTSNIQYSLNISELVKTIKAVSKAKITANNTPVRLSEKERQDIEDFIYSKLRKNNLQGKDVSVSKLLRYSLRYMMKHHEKEFIEALQEAFKNDNEL